MEFLFLKGSSERDVRIAKYIDCLTKLGHRVSFWGWDRDDAESPDARLSCCRYLCRGGGYGRKTALRYPIWMIRLFLALCFSRHLGKMKIVAVNFDAALPMFCAGLIRGYKYVYEIHDEFALSYGMPEWLKSIVRKIDHCIMRHARFVIHVDSNRITYNQCKSVVIENSPSDYWAGMARDYSKMTRTFAVVGCLSRARGIGQICEFAERHVNVNLLVAGTCYDEWTTKRISAVPNIEYHEFMPQHELFRKMESCCGVFSLYDPALEINKLAASNKVYDAMMMGIPVITNRDVLNSKFIRDQNVGVVVDYECNETWEVLADADFPKRAIEIGGNGRKLYLDQFQFQKMIENRFLPHMEGDAI